VKRVFLLIAVFTAGLVACVSRPTNTPTIPVFSSATISDGDFDWSIVKAKAPAPNLNKICFDVTATNRGVPINVIPMQQCGRFGFPFTYPHPQIIAEISNDDYFSVLLFIPLNVSVKVDGTTVGKNGYFAAFSGPISGRPIEILFKNGRCKIVPTLPYGPCEPNRKL
jgi:hypothetical protein